MKILYTVGLGLLFSLIISSCSIEKRLYNKGFHVEWNRKNKQLRAEKEADQEIVFNSQDVESTNSTPITTAQLETTDHIYEQVTFANNDEVVDNSEGEKIAPPIETKDFVVYESNELNNEIPNVESNEPKKEGLAIASLILGLLGISVVAIVLGLIQIHKVNQNPEQYGGKGMAAAGVLLGYFWIIFCSLFFMPFQLGVASLVLISLLFAVYGMIVLAKNEETDALGLLGTIFGWLGFMAGIFLMFDY